MARTVKVSKEKAKKERAREAGDKKLVDMKKLREENQKRAQRIKDRKDKQLKIIRDEKVEKQRKIHRGMQALMGIQNIRKGWICQFGEYLSKDWLGRLYKDEERD